MTLDEIVAAMRRRKIGGLSVVWIDERRLTRSRVFYPAIQRSEPCKMAERQRERAHLDAQRLLKCESNRAPFARRTGLLKALRNYNRYLELGRAEALAGNPVEAENYYQHAEHYLRSMSAVREKPIGGRREDERRDPP
jgi:hypothetical protein